VAFISFVSTYRPIICGIADYTEFLTRESPTANWEVLSFNTENFGAPLRNDNTVPGYPVFYTIPGRNDYSATDILEVSRSCLDQVVWFQHEFGIWRDNIRFVDMMKDIDRPKIVSLHSLHFQSTETVYGLTKNEYSFLRMLMPEVDAITVFSDGVFKAVTSAFPGYRNKVYVMWHGTHVYPAMAEMSRAEAKARIFQYLAYESDLDERYKENLKQSRVFLDSDTVVIGGTGFVSANKGIELLYKTHGILQHVIPGAKIAAVYVGCVRETDRTIDSLCASELRAKYNQAGQLYLQTYLPADIMPLFLRALDIYFYWPHDCTQSGIIAHALGAGATIACRDMEGVGETVRRAGGLTSADYGELVAGIKELVENPLLREKISARAVDYANRLSWGNQALRHFELAEHLSCYKPQLPLIGPGSSFLKDNDFMSVVEVCNRGKERLD
jgi:glycosyltransferase involved in cell wall biosynthesis